MDFRQYLKLRKLATKSKTLEGFIKECSKWSKYGIPLWSKKDYAQFYDRIHGGLKYESIHKRS